MNKRIWLSIRLEQLKRVSPVVYFVLQALTLALVLYSFLDWKTDLTGWILLPVLFGLILGSGFVFAWIYYDLFQMRIPEQEARFNMEPAYSSVLSPKEAWLFANLAKAMKGDESAHWSLIEASEQMRIPERELVRRKP